MTDANTDDKNKDDVVEDDSKDPKEVKGVAPTLDQVHQATQAKLEEEDASDEDESGTDGDLADDASKDSSNTDDEESDSSSADDGEEEVEATDSSDVNAPKGVDTAAAEVDKPKAPADTSESAAELNTDTTQPGEGKVAVKDAEGKTHYFNSREEVPIDFEPASYKELLDAGAKFTRKEIKDEADAAKAKTDAEETAAAEETKQRVAAMETEWERDFADLTSSGLIPKDPTKNGTAKEEVYDYMETELKKGNVITNVKQAYKSMMYDKQQAEREVEQKKVNDAKKERGGKIQSGSGGSNAGTTVRGGGKIFEAPPPGVGLDAIHNRALEQLG